MATRLCHLQQELCGMFSGINPQCLCQRYPSVWDFELLFCSAPGELRYPDLMINSHLLCL